MMGSGEYVDGTLIGKGNNKLSNHLCIFHSSESGGVQYRMECVCMHRYVTRDWKGGSNTHLSPKEQGTEPYVSR